MTTSKTPSTNRSSLIAVRVSAQERAQLVRAAGGESLSVYVRSRLFDNAGDGPVSIVRQRRDAAMLLGELGRSDIAKSLVVLSEAVESGQFVVDSEVRVELRAALADIREMRQALMRVLGLRGKARPCS